VEIHHPGCASCNNVVTGSCSKVLTYVVLVILIALWAMVLLPPYLKDRRASGRTFGSIQTGGGLSSGGMNSAQRFLPLQKASNQYSTSTVSSPTGMRTSGVNPLGTQASAALRPYAPAPSSSGPAHLAPASVTSGNPASVTSGNVVQLRPLDADAAPQLTRPLATSATAYLEDAPMAAESILHQAWDTSDNAGLGMPTSTSAARERRRHVLLGFTGIAAMTLLLALFAGGRWVAAHVLVDAVMLGYVILLVRHRQLMADRGAKVEPIRPPITDQASTPVQLAPSYLLRENTGS
jgi:hypothetical protein